jgi:hypothetical protein
MTQFFIAAQNSLNRVECNKIKKAVHGEMLFKIEIHKTQG